MDPIKTTAGEHKAFLKALTPDQSEELKELGLKWSPFRARGWTYEHLGGNNYKFTAPNSKYFFAHMDFDSGNIIYTGPQGEEMSPGSCVGRIFECRGVRAVRVTAKTVARAVFYYERLKYQLLHEEQDKE